MLIWNLAPMACDVYVYVHPGPYKFDWNTLKKWPEQRGQGWVAHVRLDKGDDQRLELRADKTYRVDFFYMAKDPQSGKREEYYRYADNVPAFEAGSSKAETVIRFDGSPGYPLNFSYGYDADSGYAAS